MIILHVLVKKEKDAHIISKNLCMYFIVKIIHHSVVSYFSNY